MTNTNATDLSGTFPEAVKREINKSYTEISAIAEIMDLLCLTIEAKEHLTRPFNVTMIESATLTMRDLSRELLDKITRNIAFMGDASHQISLNAASLLRNLELFFIVISASENDELQQPLSPPFLLSHLTNLNDISGQLLEDFPFFCDVEA
jgi:hypothetical protein